MSTDCGSRIRENQPTIQGIREQFQARAAERRAEALPNSRDEAEGNALRTGELRGRPPLELIREFSATEAPNRAAFLILNEAGGCPSALGPREIRDPRSALVTEQAFEVSRFELPVPDEVRAERLESVRGRNLSERPRFDVRV